MMNAYYIRMANCVLRDWRLYACFPADWPPVVMICGIALRVQKDGAVVARQAVWISGGTALLRSDSSQALPSTVYLSPDYRAQVMSDSPREYRRTVVESSPVPHVRALVWRRFWQICPAALDSYSGLRLGGSREKVTGQVREETQELNSVAHLVVLAYSYDARTEDHQGVRR